MLEVALAADEAYVPHAATALRSLVTSNPPGEVRAHFLHPAELRQEALALLRDAMTRWQSEIVLHPIAATSVAGLPTMGRITEVMWYRMLLPELLPSTDRILYLDCDTLVLGALDPLWALDLGDCLVGAVSNVFPPDLRHRPAQLGLAANAYFNSGVLLIDLARWRAEDTAARVMQVAQEDRDRIIFPDQDALNIVVAERRFALHPRWNCQNSLFRYRWAEDAFGATALAEARTNPAIVHFEGPAQAKPWHSRSRHPHQRTYLALRANTPWPEVSFEVETWRERLRRAVAPRPS